MANTRVKARSATSKARGGSSRTPTIAAVVVLVILAVVVFGGIFWSQRGSGAPGGAAAPIAVSQVRASFASRVDGNVIVAGTGAKVLDVYEDAQCPACKEFESLDGQKILDGLNANKLTIRYHMVNLLDSRTSPPGYSTQGGNALMCAAENSDSGSAFPTLHKTLYDQQPPEGGAGFSVQQLVDLGPGIGAGPGYASCVQTGVHAQAVKTNFAQAQSDPALQQTSGGSSGFGTPTVVYNGKLLTPGTQELEQVLS